MTINEKVYLTKLIMFEHDLGLFQAKVFLQKYIDCNFTYSQLIALYSCKSINK